MRRTIVGVTIVVVGTLLATPMAIAEEGDTPALQKQCLEAGGSWSSCFVTRSETTANPYMALVQDASDAGVGLGTRSAVQSIRNGLVD